jgi:hypothetical protein
MQPTTFRNPVMALIAGAVDWLNMAMPNSATPVDTSASLFSHQQQP